MRCISAEATALRTHGFLHHRPEGALVPGSKCGEDFTGPVHHYYTRYGTLVCTYDTPYSVLSLHRDETRHAPSILPLQLGLLPDYLPSMAKQVCSPAVKSSPACLRLAYKECAPSNHGLIQGRERGVTCVCLLGRGGVRHSQLPCQSSDQPNLLQIIVYIACRQNKRARRTMKPPCFGSYDSIEFF